MHAQMLESTDWKTLFWVKDASAPLDMSHKLSKVCIGPLDVSQELPVMNAYSQVVINVSSKAKKVLSLSNASSLLFMERQQLVLRTQDQISTLQLNCKVYDIVETRPLVFVASSIGRVQIVTVADTKISLIHVKPRVQLR